MIPIDLLKNKSVFFGLSDDQLRGLASVADKVGYEKGGVVFSEGDPGDALFIVEAGAVDLYQKREDGMGVKLATLTAGSIMGEVTLVHMEQRSATAIAADDGTELVAIRNRDLSVLFETDRELLIVILLNITRVLSKRLRAAGRKLSAEGA